MASRSIGRTHQAWTIVAHEGGTRHDIMLRLRCVCGTEKVCKADNWRASKSCGCRPKDPRAQSVVGRAFGFLTAVGPQRNNEIPCQCICGTFKVIKAHFLYEDRVKSCGCAPSANRTHGASNNRREFDIWMAQRGQRCEGWNKYQNFYNDLGPCPVGFFLNRGAPGALATCGKCAECKRTGAKQNGEWSPETTPSCVPGTSTRPTKPLCKWKVTGPDGQVHYPDFLNRFCAQHGLSNSAMCMVAQGVQANHKGWICAKLPIAA